MFCVRLNINYIQMSERTLHRNLHLLNHHCCAYLLCVCACVFSHVCATSTSACMRVLLCTATDVCGPRVLPASPPYRLIYKELVDIALNRAVSEVYNVYTHATLYTCHRRDLTITADAAYRIKWSIFTTR